MTMFRHAAQTMHSARRLTRWGAVAAVCAGLLASPAYALDGYTIAGGGASQTITEHTICRVVTNNNASSVFVPTKTANEWYTGGTSFLENLPNNVTAGACTSAINAFDFTDEPNAVASQSYSASATVSGFSGTLTANVVGTADAQIRKNSTGVWGTSVNVVSGDTINVRMNASSTTGTAKQLVVTIGNRSANWTVTTTCDDTTPDAFNFTDTTGAALNTLTTSNLVTISGIASPTTVTASNGAEFSINGGAYVTSGTIANGQTLRIRLTSSNSPSTQVSTTVNVGGVTDVWNITTTGGAMVQTFTAPGAFTWYKPSVATNYSVKVECWGAGGGGGRNSGGDEGDGGGGGGYATSEYNITSLATTITGQVGTGGLGRNTNGNGTAGGASSFSTLLYANGGGGGVGGTGRGAGGTYSGTGVVGENGGLGGTSDVGGENRTWAGGGGGGGANSGYQPGGTSTYGGKGGDGATGSGTAQHGSQPGGGGGGAQGGTSGNGGNGKCVVTTYLDDVPNAFTFTDVTNATANTLYTSNIVQISGMVIDANIAVSGSGAQFRICSTSNCSSVVRNWSTTSSTIANGQYVQLQMTSSTTAGASLSTTLTIGGVSDSWSVTNVPLNCAVTNPSWSVSGESCSATANNTINHGSTRTYSDVSGTVTGSITYRCTNGVRTVESISCAYSAGDGGGTGDNDEARDDLIWSQSGKQHLRELMERSLRDGKLH